jgi:hypothetical protein
MFGVPEDPCKRGGTTIEGGVIKNSGQECSLLAALPGLNFDAQIDVPGVLQGDLKVSGNSFEVQFPAGARGTLHFYAEAGAPGEDIQDAAAVDREYGGDIRAILSDGQYAVFSIGTKTCMRAKMR